MTSINNSTLWYLLCRCNIANGIFVLVYHKNVKSRTHTHIYIYIYMNIYIMNICKYIYTTNINF